MYSYTMGVLTSEKPFKKYRLSTFRYYIIVSIGWYCHGL